MSLIHLLQNPSIFRKFRRLCTPRESSSFKSITKIGNVGVKNASRHPIKGKHADMMAGAAKNARQKDSRSAEGFGWSTSGVDIEQAAGGAFNLREALFAAAAPLLLAAGAKYN
jgi:hypothetical protein